MLPSTTFLRNSICDSLCKTCFQKHVSLLWAKSNLLTLFLRTVRVHPQYFYHSLISEVHIKSEILGSRYVRPSFFSIWFLNNLSSFRHRFYFQFHLTFSTQLICVLKPADWEIVHSIKGWYQHTNRVKWKEISRFLV